MVISGFTEYVVLQAVISVLEEEVAAFFRLLQDFSTPEDGSSIFVQIMCNNIQYYMVS